MQNSVQRWNDHGIWDDLGIGVGAAFSTGNPRTHRPEPREPKHRLPHARGSKNQNDHYVVVF